MPVTYTCPDCDAPLKSPRALPAGKKIKCPKCGTAFPIPGDEDDAADGATRQVHRDVVPAARKRAKPVVEDDEEPEAERYEEEADEDRPRRKQPRRPLKARSGGNKGLLIGLIAGGVLLLVLGGGGLATYLFLNAGKNRGPSNEDPLAYVPADSLLVIGTDLARMIEQPGIGPEIERSLQTGASGSFLQRCQEKTGIDLKDLAGRRILAIPWPEPGSNPGFRPMGQGGPPGMPGLPLGGMDIGQTGTVIFHSRVPFNQHKIRDAAQNAKAKKLHGKTYYQVTEGNFSALYMPSDRVIILSTLTEAELGPVLTSNGTEPSLSADAAALARTGQEGVFWAVAPLDGATKQQMQRNMGEVPPQMKPLADALLNANAAGFWALLENDQLKLHASLVCSDANSARQVADTLQNLWNTQVKALILQLGSAIIPRDLKAGLQELADSARFGAQGPTARMSAQVNRRVLDALVKLGQQQGQQPGGMPGMPGMPPGGMPPGGRPRGGMPGMPPGGMPRPGAPPGQ